MPTSGRPTPPLVVGAALTDDLHHPHRLLAARRAHGALAGWWEFPGGKVEPGEDPRAALLRELEEELGLRRVRLGAELLAPDALGWLLPHGARMRVWWAVTDEELIPGPDHDQLRWVGADDVLDLGWLPGDVPLAEQLAAGGLRPHPRPPVGAGRTGAHQAAGPTHTQSSDDSTTHP